MMNETTDQNASTLKTQPIPTSANRRHVEQFDRTKIIPTKSAQHKDNCLLHACYCMNATRKS